VIRAGLRLAINTIKLYRDPVKYFRSQGAEIGKNVEIFGANLFTLGSEPYLVSIGDNVTISHNVDFITHDGGLRVVRGRYPDAHFYDRIQIADHCFIGAHCILLPGAKVGAGSVVGSGSTVTGEIPPGVVAVGVPARPIKTVEEYTRAKRHLWIDTDGLNPAAKRDLLVRRMPRVMKGSRTADGRGIDRRGSSHQANGLSMTGIKNYRFLLVP